MSNNGGSSIPGMYYPIVSSMTGSTAGQSAIIAQDNMNAKQNDANKIVSGGKKKGGAINAPQFNLLYNDPSPPGQSVNDAIAVSSRVSTQAAANAALDNGAFKKGGSKYRKGGNSKLKWSYYKGGRKKTRKNKRKPKRNGKKTRHRK